MRIDIFERGEKRRGSSVCTGLWRLLTVADTVSLHSRLVTDYDEQTRRPLLNCTTISTALNHVPFVVRDTCPDFIDRC